MHPSADTGRVIAGRYRLQAPIGRGAMGVVWRARDQLLDRDVAVKEVHIAETLTEAQLDAALDVLAMTGAAQAGTEQSGDT